MVNAKPLATPDFTPVANYFIPDHGYGYIHTEYLARRRIKYAIARGDAKLLKRAFSDHLKAGPGETTYTVERFIADHAYEISLDPQKYPVNPDSLAYWFNEGGF